MSIPGILRSRFGLNQEAGGLFIDGSFYALNMLAHTPGRVYYVKPSSGLDTKTGKTPGQALKTVQEALDRCTANKHDIVALIGEGNAAASCTDYVTDTLTWNKDFTHLVNLMGGTQFSPRARVAWKSTCATGSDDAFTSNKPLVTLSANGCQFVDMGIFAGIANAYAIGGLKITGQRNKLVGGHIAGIGDNAQDVAGAYSLLLDGAAENEVWHSVIGLDTIARGSAANSEILVDTAATRNSFFDCFVTSMLEHGTNHPQVKLADATAIDRFLRFKRCTFFNISANYTYTNGGVMAVPVLTQGMVLVEDCVGGGASKWDVNDSDKIWLFNSPTPAADTAGLARAV